MSGAGDSKSACRTLTKGLVRVPQSTQKEASRTRFPRRQGAQIQLVSDPEQLHHSSLQPHAAAGCVNSAAWVEALARNPVVHCGEAEA